MSLPEIYKNKIEDDVRHSQSVFYGKDYGKDERSELIFSNLPVNVLIETDKKMFKAQIVGKTQNYLVSSAGETIDLRSCQRIKKI